MRLFNPDVSAEIDAELAESCYIIGLTYHSGAGVAVRMYRTSTELVWALYLCSYSRGIRILTVWARVK